MDNPPIAPQFEGRTAHFMTKGVFIVLRVPTADGFVEPGRAGTYHKRGESGKRMGLGHFYKDIWFPPFELLPLTLSLPSSLSTQTSTLPLHIKPKNRRYLKYQ